MKYLLVILTLSHAVKCTQPTKAQLQFDKEAEKEKKGPLNFMAAMCAALILGSATMGSGGSKPIKMGLGGRRVHRNFRKIGEAAVGINKSQMPAGNEPLGSDEGSDPLENLSQEEKESIFVTGEHKWVAELPERTWTQYYNMWKNEWQGQCPDRL